MEGMCRLCGKIKSRLIDMLSPEGGRHQLFEKIRAYINIAVSEGDPFPKSVCMLCLGMLDHTCQFQDMCRIAQIRFHRNKALVAERARMTSEVVGQLSAEIEISLTGQNALSSTFQGANDDNYNKPTSHAFLETSSVNGDVPIDEDDESWPNQSADISESNNCDPSQVEQVICTNAMRNLIRPVSLFKSNDHDSVVSLPNNVRIDIENNKISFPEGSIVMTTRSEMLENNLSKSSLLLSSPPINKVNKTNFSSLQHSKSSYNAIPCDAKVQLKSKIMAESSSTPSVAFPVKLFSPEPSILPTSLMYSAASNTGLTQNVSSPSHVPDICTAVASAEVPSWHESLTASSSSPLTPDTTLGLPITRQHDSSLQITKTEDPSVLLKCIPSAYQIESLAFHTSFASPSVHKPVNNESTIFPQPSDESSASSILKLTLSSSKPAQRNSTLLASVTQFDLVRKAHSVLKLKSNHTIGESNAQMTMGSLDASIPVQADPSTACFVPASSNVAIDAQNRTPNVAEDNGGDGDTTLDDSRTQTRSRSGVIETCSYADVTPTSETASAIKSKDDYFEDRACGWKKYSVGDTFERGSIFYPKTVLSYLQLHQLSTPSLTQLQFLPKYCLSCNTSGTGSFSYCYNLVPRRHLAFYCRACNQIFVKRRTYVDICRRYKCLECDQEFPYYSQMRHHNQKFHEKLSFICNDCGRTFYCKGNLTKHINNIHLNIRNHKCSKCDKTFKRRRHLKDHMDMHTGTPRYVCPICGLAYYRQSLLWSHKKMIHDSEKPHKCNECDSAFKTKEQLRLHQLVHTGEKPFCCDQCGKSFARAFTLNIHVKCVHMPKSITCPLCPSMFSHKSNLKTHLDCHAKLENKCSKNKYVSKSMKKK